MSILFLSSSHRGEISISPGRPVKKIRDPITDIDGDIDRIFLAICIVFLVRRHAKPRYRPNVRRGCMCMHTCRPTTTGRTKILAICATTAAMLRRMHVGGGGRQERWVCACVCLPMYVRERGAATAAPRASLIHFHYVFAIGTLRDTLYLTFNCASHASRCNFAFFFLLFLFATFVPISIARPSARPLPRLTIQHPA